MTEQMHFGKEDVKVFAMDFFIRGDSELIDDMSPIEGVSELSFVISKNREDAEATAEKRMESVLGKPCEEAGLSIRAYDAMEVLRRHEEWRETADMVIDNLMQMIYQLAGEEETPDHVMDFLDHCDERLGIRSRNYENPCQKGYIKRILENEKGE